MKKICLLTACICLVAAIATGCGQSSTTEERDTGTATMTASPTAGAATTEATEATGGPAAAGAATLTIANLGTDLAFVNHMYRTANRTSMLYHSDAVGTSLTRTLAGFPPVAGSFHTPRVIAAPTFPGQDRLRSVDVALGTVAPRTLTLGPEIGPIVVTAVATTPTLRAQAVVPAAART